MRDAPPLTLSPEERSRLTRQRSRGGSVGIRSELILLAADGLQDTEIALRCGLHRQTVARWRRRFRSSRLPGLTDASSAIRRGRIAEERLRTVVRSTVAGRRPGGRVWSTRSLAQEFGVSHMTVQRLWEAYRIRPKRLDATPPRADPVTGARPWDVIGLSFDGPSAALALTLRPTWPGPGRAESQDDVGPAVSRRVALVLPNDYSR
ncbi:MAG: helix-turn-helix domain-containing protein, partial [Candidatus Lutacidiplasmatales archaeon]